MTRRAILLASLAAGLRADSADDVWDLVASAARALVEATALPPPNRGTARAFLSFFDPKMAEYETLRANATALIDAADLECTLDPVSNAGDDRTRNLAIDWELRLASNSAEGVIKTRRQEKVKVRAEKLGRKWRIVAIEPVAFFGP